MRQKSIEYIKTKEEKVLTEFLRTWAEIDIRALENNLREIKKRAGNKKIMAVVKANAYGHGAMQLAPVISRFADAFAVATFEEAMELRRVGTEKEILILSPVPHAQYPLIVENGIATLLFSSDGARALSEAARACKRKAGAYLAVDTGMGRIGLSSDEKGLAEAEKIYAFENIGILGIITHYACADKADKTSQSRQQADFDSFCAALGARGYDIGLRSADNSAAFIDGSDDYEMVRVGIVLFGMYPSAEVKKENLPLSPVMSLKTKITQVKAAPAGTKISYGHTFTAEKPMKIATLAAGYADGIPLSLSGRGSVIIAGKKARIVGRVCMDQMMVDVTGIENVGEGDTAVIFGSDGGATITADGVADLAGTINYDIVCRLDCRVPRVLVRNGKATGTFSYIGNYFG